MPIPFPCARRCRSFRLRLFEQAGNLGAERRAPLLHLLTSPTETSIEPFIWEQTKDPTAKPPTFDSEEIITDLLDPTDAEDIALLDLQAQGWLLLPSSRMNDTPLYEAALRHTGNGRLAVVAVKSGRQNVVPVPDVVKAVADRDAQVFVFSTHERYAGDPGELGATKISRAEIAEFMSSKPELLPPRIAHWVDLT